MPETRKIARWKLGLAYTAFGLFAFAVFLALTFPYDAARKRLTMEAAKAGWNVTMSSLGPGMFGLTAKNVRIARIEQGPPVEGAPELLPLTIPSVAIRPSLLPVGVSLDADLFGGDVSASFGGLGSGSLQLDLDELDPSKGNFKEFTGLDVAGKINGKLRLTIPAVSGPQGRSYDLSQADGTLSLDASNLVVNGGTVVVPLYNTPTPVDLPKITLGAVDGKVRIEKGLATVETLTSRGEDLELRGGGTIKLGKRMDLSELDVDLKLKAEPAFISRLGLIGSGLSVLPPDRQDAQFRAAKLSGMAGSPKFGPGR